ncbi:MAG: choice-of-anchor X domain-containing protein [Candidatus Sumerlaeaceae bacterium]
MKQIILAGAISVLAFTANAQNTYNGFTIFATGENPPLDNFNPGTSSALQLLNDGTGGDTVASDNIWSRNVTITSSPAATLNQRFLWKIGSGAPSAQWAFSYPGGFDNSWSRYLPGTMKFLFDTATRNDGYVPDPGVNAFVGLLYTSPSPVAPGNTVRVVGNFISELGGNDWTTTDPTGNMNDSGTAGDTASGDGIFTLSFTGVAAGSYEFKILVNPSNTVANDYARQVSNIGYATGGGNLSANIFATSDQIKVLFDSSTGRTKVTNSNPLANPGPPFFATSSAWNVNLNATTQMYDNGTNGDAISGDGIHSRLVTTTAGGAGFTVNVKQGVGPQYPGTGGYPIDIATTGQTVLVHFDTNVRSDGYSPDTRYVWTDPNSRHVAVPNVVGAVQDELGGAEWDPTSTNFTLVDTGASGDLAAGDKLFGLNFTAFLPITAQNWKGCVLGGYEYQFGCPGAGYTRGGSNPEIPFTSNAGTVNFQIDAITGRIAAFANAVTPTAPFRASFLNNLPGAGVNDWSMY